MRIRWLPLALAISLLANLGLIALILVMALDAGHYEADQASSWNWMTRERRELHAMRAHFCPANSAPERAEVLSWEASVRPPESMGQPFEKDGLLWLDTVGVRFDEQDRLVGVCLSHAWGLLDDPPPRAQDAAGDLCLLEPLC